MHAGCLQRSYECFPLADYGNVVELRINSGGKLPNFGFVVFDDSEPVQKVLNNRVSKFAFCVSVLCLWFWLTCVCPICAVPLRVRRVGNMPWEWS